MTTSSVFTNSHLTKISPLDFRYTITQIKEEAKGLIDQGCLTRKHPIYTLCEFIPARLWNEVELELERNGFLLRDHLIDLVSQETWESD